jgi:hypothetical protein
LLQHDAMVALRQTPHLAAQPVIVGRFPRRLRTTRQLQIPCDTPVFNREQAVLVQVSFPQERLERRNRNTQFTGSADQTGPAIGPYRTSQRRGRTAARRKLGKTPHTQCPTRRGRDHRSARGGRMNVPLKHPRARGAGSGALLWRELRAPVKTYWPDPSTILEALSVSDDQTDKVANTIAGSRHSQPVGCQQKKTPVDQLEQSPIQIYCCTGEFRVRAGRCADNARIRIPVSTGGVSFCGIFGALVAGVGEGHYRRLHGLTARQGCT